MAVVAHGVLVIVPRQTTSHSCSPCRRLKDMARGGLVWTRPDQAAKEAVPSSLGRRFGVVVMKPVESQGEAGDVNAAFVARCILTEVYARQNPTPGSYSTRTEDPV